MHNVKTVQFNLQILSQWEKNIKLTHEFINKYNHCREITPYYTVDVLSRRSCRSWISISTYALSLNMAAAIKLALYVFSTGKLLVLVNHNHIAGGWDMECNSEPVLEFLQLLKFLGIVLILQIPGLFFHQILNKIQLQTVWEYNHLLKVGKCRHLVQGSGS